MPTNLTLGQDYYYISATDYANLAAAVQAAGFQMSDFPCYEVTQSGYAGYYFALDEIDMDNGEWDVLANFGSFTTRTIYDSVQAVFYG